MHIDSETLNIGYFTFVDVVVCAGFAFSFAATYYQGFVPLRCLLIKEQDSGHIHTWVIIIIIIIIIIIHTHF